MKPKTPAIFDFRLQINHDIDLVLTAKARALGLDKAAVARDVLAKWAADEMNFCACMKAEEDVSRERVANNASRRRQLTRAVQNSVFKRDGFTCRSCRAEPLIENLHIDHIVPLSAGGSDDLSNLQVLCRDCNLSKGSKIVPLKPPNNSKA
jgi:5-methylcytosine-specific restriction enzyme A